MKRSKIEAKAYLLAGFQDYLGAKPQPYFGPRFRVFNFIRAKSDFLYELHTHDNMEMIIPLKGVYKCLVNAEELSFTRGTALLLQKGDVHQDIYLKGMEYCGAIFRLEMRGSVVNRLFRSGIKPKSQLASFKSIGIMAQVRDSLSKPGLFSEYLASSALQTVFWEAVSSVPKGLLSQEFLEMPEGDAFRKRLLTYFGENMRSQLTLDGMAKALGLSKSSISHKCVELLGVPPAKAFLGFRLERAKAMLQGSNLSVKEVCDALGFPNQFHFSRAFKRRFGLPPSCIE